MDNKVFPDKNNLPNVLVEMIKDKAISALSPGESTWVVPWALSARDGVVSISQSMGDRDQKPGGTLKLKVVKDFDGLFIDASALTLQEVEECFDPNKADKSPLSGGEQYDNIFVIGVIYPIISDTSGIDPSEAAAFNLGQKESRSSLSVYFKQTYDMDYIFADNQVLDNRR